MRAKLEYLGDKLVEYSSAEYDMYNEKDMRDEISRLRASNAIMLEALEYADQTFSRFMRDDVAIEEYPAIFKIRQAIAKAK